MPTSQLTYLESSVKMPLMSLPVRSTLVQLSKGLVLISPHPRLTTDDYVQMADVTEIVAPNCFHHLGAKKARANLLQAKTWAAPGLRQKRPDLEWDFEFEKDRWPHESELAFHTVKGMPKVNEAVFFHFASGSLICADLCFNLEEMSGFGAYLWLTLFGTLNRFAASRLFTMAIKDKRAFKESLGLIFQWPIKRIVMGHGAILETNAVRHLQTAYRERNLY